LRPGCPHGLFSSLVRRGEADEVLAPYLYGLSGAFNVTELRHKPFGLHCLSGRPLVAVDGHFPGGFAGVALPAFAAFVRVIDARSVPIDRVR